MYVITLVILEKDFYDNVEADIKLQEVATSMPDAYRVAEIMCGDMIGATPTWGQLEFIHKQLENFQSFTLATGDWEIFVKEVK